jgi:hypothetical protein
MDLFLLILNYWIPLLNRPSGIDDVFVGTMTSVFSLRLVAAVQDAEDKVLSNTKTLPFIVSMFKSGFVRMFYFTVIVLFLPKEVYRLFWEEQKRGVWFFDLYCSLSGLVFMAFLYFMAVNPLPPGISKVGQWIERLAAGFRKVQPARSPNT